MAKSKKIAIIGHFGGKENILDGQTIKTKILYEELLKATNWKIKKVDTYYKSKRPILLALQSITCLITTKDIFVLLSGNGMRMYFPLLGFFARVFHTRVYHDVIGGNLDRYVKTHPKFKKSLNAFRINWVETGSMMKKLGELGITNCKVLPNFKRLNCVEAESIQADFYEPYRFCTFSRIMKEKGIEDAIETVESINAEARRIVCTLDIYGKVDNNYKVCFDEVMKKATSAIKYGGLIPYDKSVEAIKDYYALLFPTNWDGEGFAGTIVDAFSAGLPVIASDWNCNGEIIKNKFNGILYPSDSMQTLKDAVLWAIENKEIFIGMGKKCVESAKRFQPDEYIVKIKEFVEKK